MRHLKIEFPASGEATVETVAAFRLASDNAATADAKAQAIKARRDLGEALAEVRRQITVDNPEAQRIARLEDSIRHCAAQAVETERDANALRREAIGLAAADIGDAMDRNARADQLAEESRSMGRMRDSLKAESAALKRAVNAAADERQEATADRMCRESVAQLDDIDSEILSLIERRAGRLAYCNAMLTGAAYERGRLRQKMATAGSVVLNGSLAAEAAPVAG